jgi:hypothetical protein
MSARAKINLDSWEEAVDAIHRLMAGEQNINRRVREIAELFVGRPYLADSLIGGPQEREKLVFRLEAFDCITFIESVLALARTRSRRGFITELKKLRYRDGMVDWYARLHYFSDWVRHHEKRGVVKRRTRGSGSRSIDATMGLIDGLPARRTRLQVVPKKDIPLALGRIPRASVIAFASVRPRLDYFHTGLLFSARVPAQSMEDLLIYSPPKSIGRVIKEPLSDFLKRNRMRGVSFAEIMGTGAFK